MYKYIYFKFLDLFQINQINKFIIKTNLIKNFIKKSKNINLCNLLFAYL